MELIVQPATSDRLGEHIKENLLKDWTHFRAAVAFVKRSGTRHIITELADFAKGREVEIVVGIDHRGTSMEGLRDLLQAVNPTGRIIVLHNRLPFTFHPKLYLFKRQDMAEILIGSGNITEGGLFTNYEASLCLHLNLTDARERALFQSIDSTLDRWADPSAGVAHHLDDRLLDQLVSNGLVPSEAIPGTEAGKAASGTDDESWTSPFAAHPVPPAPMVPRPAGRAPANIPSNVAVIPAVSHFVMTLQKTDVGVGQTSTGTSRRSPEIFIPLAARNANPDFWDWPGAFTADSARPDKYDRRGVRMRLGTTVVLVNMMTWPIKRDFRLRCEALRSAGNIDDILHLEKVDPTIGYEYFAEVIPQGTSQYLVHLALCNHPVRNSKKLFGYY